MNAGGVLLLGHVRWNGIGSGWMDCWLWVAFSDLRISDIPRAHFALSRMEWMEWMEWDG